MASVGKIGDKLTRIIDKSVKKESDDDKKINQLCGKWKGQGQVSFQNAYQEVPSLCKKIKMQAQSAKSKLSSLESAIQLAERDMKEKKVKTKSKKR
jgi:uncharacterized protein YukE